MPTELGPLRDKKLFEELIIPSWLSGLVAITFTLLLIIVTIALTRLGNNVQQSLIGLQHVYAQSTIGGKAITVSDNFASNVFLNDVLLFLLWGSVGLMVYSVVRGTLSELKRANTVIQELHYVNADRRNIVRDTFTREGVKIVGFILWWVLFRYAVFSIAPYTIIAAHMVAMHPTDISAWERGLFSAILCILTIHVLTVLVRLCLLRPRIFGAGIEE